MNTFLKNILLISLLLAIFVKIFSLPVLAVKDPWGDRSFTDYTFTPYCVEAVGSPCQLSNENLVMFGKRVSLSDYSMQVYKQAARKIRFHDTIMNRFSQVRLFKGNECVGFLRITIPVNKSLYPIIKTPYLSSPSLINSSCGFENLMVDQALEYITGAIGGTPRAVQLMPYGEDYLRFQDAKWMMWNNTTDPILKLQAAAEATICSNALNGNDYYFWKAIDKEKGNPILTYSNGKLAPDGSRYSYLPEDVKSKLTNGKEIWSTKTPTGKRKKVTVYLPAVGSGELVQPRTNKGGRLNRNTNCGGAGNILECNINLSVVFIEQGLDEYFPEYTYAKNHLCDDFDKFASSKSPVMYGRLKNGAVSVGMATEAVRSRWERSFDWLMGTGCGVRKYMNGSCRGCLTCKPQGPFYYNLYLNSGYYSPNWRNEIQ